MTGSLLRNSLRSVRRRGHCGRVRLPNDQNRSRAMDDAVPRIPHRVLHVLPGVLAAVLEFVPTLPQVGLDIVPVATTITVRRLVSVAVPRRVIVEAAIRARVWPSAPVPAPVLLLPLPVAGHAARRAAGAGRDILVAIRHQTSSFAAVRSDRR